ncbi:hypothetical protein D3C85_1394910 [compost metagenome]
MDFFNFLPITRMLANDRLNGRGHGEGQQHQRIFHQLIRLVVNAEHPRAHVLANQDIVQVA